MRPEKAKSLWTAPQLSHVAPVEDELNPVEEFVADKRPMASLIGTALPLDLAHVDRVA
jgi:hypothetical protein